MKLKKILYKYSILITIFSLMTSCKKESNKNVIWEKFKVGIENRNLTYLSKNSMDSINCVDCIATDKNKLKPSQLIFEKYLKNMYNIELLEGMKYSNYQTDSIIRTSL